jgi:hypothetical protein
MVKRNRYLQRKAAEEPHLHLLFPRAGSTIEDVISFISEAVSWLKL